MTAQPVARAAQLPRRFEVLRVRTQPPVPDVGGTFRTGDVLALPIQRVGVGDLRLDGKERKVRVRADAGGNARFKYRLSKRFPLGNYQITATASARGLDGSTSTSFLLQ